MRVIGEILFSGRHPIPFQIKRLTLRQVERSGLTPQCFRNSFEGDGILPARRLPSLFLNVVDVYLAHFILLSFRPKCPAVAGLMDSSKCRKMSRPRST